MTEKTRGGARPGAGRPKKARDPGDELFETAEEYLRAVVSGKIPADSVRVAAAKTLICYEAKKIRAPKPALPPSKMEATEARAVETATADAFEQVAATIRKRHGR